MMSSWIMVTPRMVMRRIEDSVGVLVEFLMLLV
jgi:hypothetical protein